MSITRIRQLSVANFGLVVFGNIGAMASKSSDSALFPVSLGLCMVASLSAFVTTMFAVSKLTKSSGAEKRDWRLATLWAAVSVLLNLIGVVVVRNLVPTPGTSESEVIREI